MSEKESNGTRLREIISVIHKHQIARGVTPEKLRLILEDLGPTYIKLGQIMSMRSDIFPKKICDEFMRLRSEVTPMPFSEVREVIEHAYGTKLEDVFEEIQETPIGSASIAQVHKAKLKSGETVVVKVQRKGIYETHSNLLIIYIYTQDLTLPSVLYKLHLYSRSTFQKQLLYLIQQKHSHPLSTPLPQTHPTSLRYGSIVSESYH